MTIAGPAPSRDNDYQLPHAVLLAASFKQLTGRCLIDANQNGAELARSLYEADFVLVSHGTEPDPVFNYANRTAQRLFELDWTEFVQLPSRKSAEPVNRADRALLMERVSNDGYIDDYAGIRISSSGKRFRIEAATVWNLLDAAGKVLGQAATFDQWVYL